MMQIELVTKNTGHLDVMIYTAFIAQSSTCSHPSCSSDGSLESVHGPSSAWWPSLSLSATRETNPFWVWEELCWFLTSNFVPKLIWWWSDAYLSIFKILTMTTLSILVQIGKRKRSHTLIQVPPLLIIKVGSISWWTCTDRCPLTLPKPPPPRSHLSEVLLKHVDACSLTEEIRNTGEIFSPKWQSANKNLKRACTHHWSWMLKEELPMEHHSLNSRRVLLLDLTPCSQLL